MKISILHPSRNRAKIANQVMRSWLGNSSQTIDIEYILSIDTDDSQMAQYERYFSGCKIIINPNKNVVMASNEAAKVATGDIFVLVSDDFECYKNWDLDIVNAFEGHSGKVLKTNDGTNGWIVTLPIMDKVYFIEHGYFYHPEFEHLFADTHMTHLAELEGRLLVRNDLKFYHAHYSTGKTRMDAVNVKADSTHVKGMKTYLEMVRNNFGLIGVDAMNVSSQETIDWLKANLK